VLVVDGDLRVVALLEASEGLHDPALWIGEVVLGLVLGHPEVPGEARTDPRALALVPLVTPLLAILLGLALLQALLRGLGACTGYR